MTVGRNTVSGQQLASYIERIEKIRADKKQLGADEAAVLAEAKSAGFVKPAIQHVVKLRAMKPHERQEAEAIVDTYLHAIGMAADTPLFRQVGLMDVDKASRDEVIEALKRFVPETGSITVEAGGRPVRLTRDKSGEVLVTEVAERPEPAAGPAPRSSGPVRPEAPAVDAEGAEDLGRQAFKDNQPIIANPFPFGDARRGRWDQGWRKESGSDGMGPDED